MSHARVLSTGSDSAPMSSSLRIIDVRGLPVLGGTVSAECRWLVPQDLLRRAGGQPIRLSSHLRGPDGRMLAFDGPRSAPIWPEDSLAAVVPLTIPTPPGNYFVDFDAVVESQFWASQLSMSFPTLRVHRHPNGTIDASDDASGLSFRVPAPAGGTFRIPHRRYGEGESERCIEIPWVLSRYRNEHRVLDIGTAFAEQRYIDALASLNIPTLTSLDLVTSRVVPGIPIVGDARRPPLRPGAIDLIFAISVIEHVGRDNSIYLKGQHGPTDSDGDLSAVKALGTLLSPGGRLLLTVPYGRLEHHGWFIQYDAMRLLRLIDESGLLASEVEFFRYSRAWRGPVRAASLTACRYGERAIAASGLACITLVNRSAAAVRLRNRMMLLRRSIVG